MTLGMADKQGDLLDDVTRFCDETLDEHSIYAFLHRERDQLFPDEAFADLFGELGRRSVPPSVVAVVMVLQRLEGLSDREATEALLLRQPLALRGWRRWLRHHRVDELRPHRARRHARAPAALRASQPHLRCGARGGQRGRAHRSQAGARLGPALRRGGDHGHRHPHPLGHPGTAQGLGPEFAFALRCVLKSGDDYASSGKPMIDWDDEVAREALVDSRAKDAYAALVILDGRVLDPV